PRVDAASVAAGRAADRRRLPAAPVGAGRPAGARARARLDSDAGRTRATRRVSRSSQAPTRALWGPDNCPRRIVGAVAPGAGHGPGRAHPALPVRDDGTRSHPLRHAELRPGSLAGKASSPE